MAHSHLPPLPRSDPAWGRVEYLIKLGLRSTSIDLLSVHPLAPPNADARFRSDHKGAAILDSFVSTAELQGPNSLDSVIKRGGRFYLADPEQRIHFTTGAIEVSQPAASHLTRQLYEFILCRIAVTHPIILDEGDINAAISSEFDCIKLQSTDSTTDADPDHYFHEFILRDDNNALALFLVSFTFDPSADVRKRNPICEQCDVNAASLYCLQDDARLCDRCDVELHSKSKVLEKHTRVPVSEVQGNLTLSRCRQHPDMPIQFYDTVTHEAVCVHCKMVGSHSTGEKARHALVTISEAYTENMTNLLQEQDLVNQGQHRIALQLKSVDDRLCQVHANASALERQLRDLLLQIFEQLQADTQKKLHLLWSDEAELRRRLQYYDWLDSFMAYQKDMLDPVDFLTSCRHHLSLLKEAPQHPIECSPAVMMDCRLRGHLELESVPSASCNPNTPLRVNGLMENRSMPTPPTTGRGHSSPEACGYAPAPPYSSSPKPLKGPDAMHRNSYHQARNAFYDMPAYPSYNSPS